MAGTAAKNFFVSLTHARMIWWKAAGAMSVMTGSQFAFTTAITVSAETRAQSQLNKAKETQDDELTDEYHETSISNLDVNGDERHFDIFAIREVANAGSIDDSICDEELRL